MGNPLCDRIEVEKAEMWEYRRIEHRFLSGMPHELNTCGKDGWEAYFHMELDGGSVVSYLKRRIK